MRQDAMDDIERRLANDDIVFDESKLGKVDFIINSYDISLEDLATQIYQLYHSSCQERRR